MATTNWEQHIQIDRNWVNRQFNAQFKSIEDKIHIDLYSIKVSGTTVIAENLAEEMQSILPHYIYSKSDIEKIGALKAGTKVNQFFGQRQPNTDGKYGELLLFGLVEGVLGSKMVAHKIRTLTNYTDQVKGGDGIFLGNYLIPDGRNMPAYFIGESKVMKDYNAALSDALESINRFCDNSISSSFLNTELIVAKENLIVDDSIDFDEMFNRLTPTSDEFRAQILVLPILLMFNSKLINENDGKHACSSDFEIAIKNEIDSSKEKIINSIKKKVSNYPSVCKTYVHFFLLPFSEVDHFRDSMYYKIHGIPYKQS